MIIRPTLGVYTLTELPQARIAAARAHGVVSHLSAAAHWGLDRMVEPADVHVTVRPGSSPARQPRVVVHRSDLTDGDVVSGVTSPLRTVLDCAALLPFGEALAVADSALRVAQVSSHELREAALASRGPGRPARIRVSQEADPRAANPFESALRGIVLDAGVGGFQPQLEVPLAGTSYWVDLGDPMRKVALEADSFAFHGSRQALERDCRRYDQLVQAGWLVLRYAWEHVMFDHGWVRQTLIDTCQLRP